MSDADITGAADAGTEPRTGPDWSDPRIPVGDSPPLPRWPLVVSSVLFVLWFGFLVTMMVVRIRTTPY